ncbi:hypothetical protein [Cohnella terricola]|uniref:Uncharacterized protein n=1 Tax=Cohnella terricola TaxID=1289167 RepID=A0A559JDL9_9BACL|nr:hypothetical protein [Cohnella terricola]TVX97974.1 hypothetical protein FPZ45_17165 [Cohnella terricola]
MAQPVVSWWNSSNTSQITQWQVGTVDAGSISPDTTFLVWNNRGGNTDLSDMQSVTITTKAPDGSDGGPNFELITNKWIEVRVDSMGEIGWTPIGGTATKAMKAGGSAPASTIKGAINDGTTANSIVNFAQFTAHAHPHATATAGNVDFLMRVSYTYV